MIRNIFTHQLTATTAKISNSPQSPPKTRGKASILNLRLFHVGLTGRVMDTLKIAPPRRRKLDPRERNPVRCLLHPPSSTLASTYTTLAIPPTLSPRNISRLIYFSAARGGPRERSRAVLFHDFHEENARVDKRKVMGYSSWPGKFICARTKTGPWANLY